MQIETRLENPTKYHVLESQKRQVAEYLSESSPGAESSEQATPLTPAKQGVTQGVIQGAPCGSRRVSGPFSPSISSAATSPSEYTPSEVSLHQLFTYVNMQFINHLLLKMFFGTSNNLQKLPVNEDKLNEVVH